MSSQDTSVPSVRRDKKGIRHRYYAVLDVISKLCVAFTGVSLVILTVIFGWLVYGRYVMNDTPTWVEQVSLLLVAYITFIGAAVGVHQSTHLGVSYFRDICPRPIRRLFVFITHLVLTLFGAVMMISGYQLAVFKWGSLIPLIHVPEGLRAIPIAVGGGLILLFSLGHLIRITAGDQDDDDVLSLD